MHPKSNLSSVYQWNFLDFDIFLFVKLDAIETWLLSIVPAYCYPGVSDLDKCTALTRQETVEKNRWSSFWLQRKEPHHYGQCTGTISGKPWLGKGVGEREFVQYVETPPSRDNCMCDLSIL